MSQTEDLLHLVNEFPHAFADPEHSGREGRISRRDSGQDDTSFTETKTQQLLQLIQEFPDAFVDPCLAGTLTGSSEAEKTAGSSAPELQELASDLNTACAIKAESHPPALDSLPTGYAYALRRRVQTLTWGSVDFNLVYGTGGLEEIWITVGKSGTEVQSLSEAIARLINLLLLRQVPVLEIIRQIRGIHGADSEGLGPHRILGLADLIGKVLQEAPADWGSAQIPQDHESDLANLSVTSSPTQRADLQDTEELEHDPPSVMDFSSSQNGVLLAEILSSEAVGASLCPECGAELSQVNGCKGGACVVCGYSSCS